MNLVVFTRNSGASALPLPLETRTTGEPDDFWVKNYLENGLKLPKMQKCVLKCLARMHNFFEFCFLQQTIQKVSL